MDKNIIDSMIASLKAKEKLGEIELTQEVDPSMIGGFILQYDDKMIDSSVSRRLTALKGVIEDDTYIKKYS